MTPGDRFVVFESFHGGPPAGAAIVGAWTFADGEATVLSAAGKVSYVVWNQAPTGSETISTHVTIDQVFAANGAPRSAGTETEFDPSASGMACEHYIASSASEAQNQDGLIETGANVIIATTPLALTAGLSTTFIESHGGTSYSCSSDATPTPLTASNGLASTAPKIGIRTHSMSAHFDWIAIIASP
jgi:hypothetical protein